MALNSPSSWNIIPKNKDITLDDVYLYSRAVFTSATSITKKAQSIKVDLSYNKKIEKMQEAYANLPVLVSRIVAGLTDAEEDRLNQLFVKYGTPYSSTSEGSINGEPCSSQVDGRAQGQSSQVSAQTATKSRKRPVATDGVSRGIVAPKRSYVRKQQKSTPTPAPVHYEIQTYDDNEEFEDDTNYD